jgi:hypothetical protein
MDGVEGPIQPNSGPIQEARRKAEPHQADEDDPANQQPKPTTEPTTTQQPPRTSLRTQTKPTKPNPNQNKADRVDPANANDDPIDDPSTSLTKTKPSTILTTTDKADANLHLDNNLADQDQANNQASRRTIPL